MTRRLFQSSGCTAPRVINIKDLKTEVAPSVVVSVMRPSKLGNPFKVGSYLTLASLKAALSTVQAFPNPGETDEEWVKRFMPHAHSVMARYKELGCPLGRSEAISCYGEWIRVAVRTDPLIRGMVLSLEGGVIGCCCKPKACHADEIVKVFKEMKKGLL